MNRRLLGPSRSAQIQAPNIRTSPRRRPNFLNSNPEAANAKDNKWAYEKRGKKVKLLGTECKQSDAQYHDSPALQLWQSSTPITPSLDTQGVNDGLEGCLQQRQHSREHSPLWQPIDATETYVREAPQTLSPQPEQMGEPGFEAVDGTQDLGLSETSLSAQMHGATVMAGEIGPSSSKPQKPESSTTGLFRRPRPAVLDTTAAQDISLPSPSLSPVTAAANLQSRRGYFEDLGSLIENKVSDPKSSSLNSQNISIGNSVDTVSSGIWAQGSRKARESPILASSVCHDLPPPSMMDIPTMLDSFEAMPSEMKSYVMYQLLRRCPKTVLHVVAEVVNPTLKCDFLNLLPVELRQNVIGNLDVKSLCRAAQVSKKWRHVINSDEKTWKNLFDAEGFTSPPGELHQAIWEGWGWQHASGFSECEQNIGDCGLHDSDSPLPSATHPNIDTCSNTNARSQGPQSRRSKRKVTSRSKPSGRKHQKRKDTAMSAVAQFDYEALMKHVSAAEGPYAAANAAAIAVPFSSIGLPSLRSLSLYKSLYKRHCLIRRTWMQDEVKPRHIAFKAHQRHVVTCLQFDTDKILTGSDDTNINVYDTRTGTLKARLEGHEGGVWALQYEGNILVSGSTDRSVRVWDIEKGICTQVFQGHTSTVRCLQILKPTKVGTALDGKAIMVPKQPLIITGSRDSNLRVWKLPKPDDPYFIQSGQPQDDTECPYFVRALTGHHHSVRAIAAHTDTLVSGSYDCTVRVWKISTGETIHRLQGHTQKVYSVVLDHERNRCISGSMDNMVKVWSLDTGSVLYNLEGHSSLVGLLDLQQNRLVSAAADSTLRIWDPETGHCKSTLSAHATAITCFQHDGQKVVSGSDRTLKMWNVNTGEFVKDLLTGLNGVWQVKFDDRRCVAAVQRNNYTYIEVSPCL